MCVFLYVTKWSSGLPKLKPKDSWGTMGTHTSSKTEIQFILDILLNTSSPPCSQGCLVLPPPHPHPLLCSSPVCTSGNFSSPDILRWYLILPSLWRSFSSDWLFTVPPLKIKSWSVSEIRSRKFSFVIPAMEHPPSTLTTSRELVIWTELFFFFFYKKKRPGVRSANMLCSNHPESLELWEVKKRQAVFPLSAFLINFDLSHFSIGCLHIHFIQERWRKFQRKSKKHKNDFLKKVQQPLERSNRRHAQIADFIYKMHFLMC